MRDNRFVQFIDIAFIKADEREIFRHAETQHIKSVESIHGDSFCRQDERLDPTPGCVTENIYGVLLGSLSLVINLMDSDLVL